MPEINKIKIFYGANEPILVFMYRSATLPLNINLMMLPEWSDFLIGPAWADVREC